ncbi:MAG: metallophosphoesterase [Endomicrobia bacterium]|nr:metallophosphoesterase [Endomicrobiia bacterium]
MREWGYFLFFLSFFCFYFAGSMYAAWRVNAGLKLIAPYKHYIYIAAALMAAVSAIAYAFSKYNIEPFAVYLGVPGGIWMGIVGISATVFILNDLINCVNLIFKIKKFRYYSTVVSLVFIAALVVWSLMNAAFILKVKEVKIKVPDLKTDSLSITLLSDIHIDKHVSFRSVQKIVDMANSLNSDIIAITGDIADSDLSETYAKYGLDKLHARYGIFAVTGNHEYYTGAGYYIKLCEELGIVLLRNENIMLKDGDKEIIAIAGINDKKGKAHKVDDVDIEAAFEGIENNVPVLFLSHRPEYFDFVKNKEMSAVQLSGHTHAGQIPPLEFIRKLMKYNYGVYESGAAKMYVTSGNRWWRIPMRTFNASEIVKITLEKQE